MKKSEKSETLFLISYYVNMPSVVDFGFAWHDITQAKISLKENYKIVGMF